MEDSDVAIVCRLAHRHLGDGHANDNDVLRRLPVEFGGNFSTLAENISCSLEVPPMLRQRAMERVGCRSSSSSTAFIYQRIVEYQSQHGHDQPPSRMTKLTHEDNWHAKRIVCELLKAWAARYQEDAQDAQDLDGYCTFLTHMLYYGDRWTGKLFSSDKFVDVLCVIARSLDDLKRITGNSRTDYRRLLLRLYEDSCELLDNALRVTVLGVTDCHAEMEVVASKKGQLTIRLQSQRSTKNSSSFWCSDYGQLIDACLVRADPVVFQPACAGVPTTNQSLWVAFTNELGQHRLYEYASEQEAQQGFDRSRCCIVLCGPDGKLQDKNYSSGTGMVSNLLEKHPALKDLHRRVDQYISLQQAAAAAAGRGVDEPPPGCWSNQFDTIKKKWKKGDTDIDKSGLAEPFRGDKRLKWVEGVFNEKTVSSDFPSLITAVAEGLSHLLRCHTEVMGPVRTLITEGGPKEALAALYGLRLRGAITGTLAKCADDFLYAASLVHGFFQAELFRGLETNNKKLKGQTPAMQRCYYESYQQCVTLRKKILTQWHELDLQFSDAHLAEEFRRIDADSKLAFSQLLGVPALPAPPQYDAMEDVTDAADTGSEVHGACGYRNDEGVEAAMPNFPVAGPPPKQAFLPGAPLNFVAGRLGDGARVLSGIGSTLLAQVQSLDDNDAKSTAATSLEAWYDEDDNSAEPSRSMPVAMATPISEVAAAQADKLPVAMALPMLNAAAASVQAPVAPQIYQLASLPNAPRDVDGVAVQAEDEAVASFAGASRQSSKSLQDASVSIPEEVVVVEASSVASDVECSVQAATIAAPIDDGPRTCDSSVNRQDVPRSTSEEVKILDTANALQLPRAAAVVHPATEEFDAID